MLKGKRVQLVPIKREHIEYFLKWFNDPEITQYLLRYRPMTRMAEEEWIENLKNRDNNINFAISILSEDTKEKIIGNCGIHEIDWKNRFGALGIMIGEKEYQNKGYGTEAVELLVEYGFNTVNLNRIELYTHDFNIRALKSYKKVGFIEEGRKRKSNWINGKYNDEILMGLLAEEWRERKKI
ncbi:MAG: GNAT family N-acetyltransferase [Candidatus Thorarchaeota archaeon]